SYTTDSRTKYLLVGVVALLAFAAAYGVASAASRTADPLAAVASAGQKAGEGQGAGAAQDGEACGGECGGSGRAETEGSTTVSNGVQRISVDVSGGFFDPTVIRAQAGVPLEIVFGEGSGCLAEVQFPQFGVLENLTRGGATVKLPSLDPGTYDFSCGMEMVFGTLVVE
ncbi:MAG: cupredoxin domain-containing protein, partial [Coriobacteriia bacterium]|nr:cupredoxin domain-containing protein [Coriobacteriia bacterium]